MPKKSLLLIPVLLLVFLAGCNAPVKLQGIGRVAVLTLDNYTIRSELGAEIKRELLAQMPKGLAVEVIDGAALESVLPLNGIEAALCEPGRALELGRRFGVDAFVVGAATAYSEDQDDILKLGWEVGHKFDAEFRVEIGVTVGFNLRLLRASDSVSVLYRQAASTKEEVLAFGLGHPYISFQLSAVPRYQDLREQAIHEAVGRLLREIGKEYGR